MDAVVLASNDMSRVQAVAITHDGGTFWAPQYHPEFTFGEVGRLIVGRADNLVEEGHFSDRAAALLRAEQFAALENAPDDAASVKSLVAGPGVTDGDLRRREIKNWFDAKVRPSL
jgi:GMP synthase (glutamine-hydrolysing)